MTAGQTISGRLGRPENLQRLARGILLVFFLWLTGRFWHPYYGFTRFLQLDQSDAAVLLPELREAPIYVYHYSGGYDGVAYAQLAAHPAVRDPALVRAVDSLPYRARRILLSWIAYAAGGGDPVRAVWAYAALNLVVWLGLAWLLAKIFPPQGWRNLVAWAGLLFSAGALDSVRLALTDLAAFALLAAALWQAERRCENQAVGLLGAAGLVRETALLGGFALWSGFGRKNRGANLTRLALAFVPLGLWLAYLKINTGPVVQGMGNFGWPVIGWVEKLTTSLRALGHEPDIWLAFTTLLAFASLTVQLIYILRRWQPGDPWRRLGAIYGGLMLCLGTAVWAGHPGAATRILLPLSLAFNVLAVRRTAAAGWLLAGNLAVFSGVLVLWQVPHDTHEVAAGRAARGAYVVHTDDRWHPAEFGRDKTWAWCAAEGGLQFDFRPRADGPANIEVAVRGISSRPLEIRQDNHVLWDGSVSERVQWIELPAVAVVRGRAQLELRSSAPGVRESADKKARALGFAIYGVRVD
ncbi:MAG TPA: hypothetical protein VKC51_00075 [Lacunisphaera sp.]|nr:hypothetical protein [Lacunisphaera sp.]